MFGIKMPRTKRKEEKAKRVQELKMALVEERLRSITQARNRMRAAPPAPQIVRQAREDRTPTACELARDGEYLGLMQYAYGSQSQSARSEPSHSAGGGSFDGGGASGDWSSFSSPSCDSSSSSSSSDSSSSSCSSGD